MFNSFPLVLGTAGFGVNKALDFELLENYVASGGNHFDTAHIYGENQASERTIGQWLKERSFRSKVFVATKGAHPSPATMHLPRLSREEIRKDLDESLIALGLDYIDLYYLHRDHSRVFVGEIAETMNELVNEGKILNWGVSNWRGKRIAEANSYAKEHGLAPISCSQIKFSLVKTNKDAPMDDTLVEMDATEYDFYNKTKMPVMAFSPQAKGYFSKLKNGESHSKKAYERYNSPQNIKTFNILSGIADRHGVSVSSVVLSWLMSCPFPVFPVIGTSSLAQLKESMEAVKVKLTNDEFVLLRQ